MTRRYRQPNLAVSANRRTGMTNLNSPIRNLRYLRTNAGDGCLNAGSGFPLIVIVSDKRVKTAIGKVREKCFRQLERQVVANQFAQVARRNYISRLSAL